LIHSTRHTFASQLGRAGVGLVQAQRLLGHSTPELTAQVYTHLGIEDLRGAVEKLEPAAKRRAKRGA
jgi:integrase